MRRLVSSPAVLESAGVGKPDGKPKPENTPIGLRIQQARQAMGLSQAQLGRLVGKESQSISKIERGIMRPAGDTLVSLARELDRSAEWIMTGEAPPDSHVEREIPESFRIWREQLAPPDLPRAVEERMLDTHFRYPPEDAARWTIIYHEVLAEMRGRTVASQEQATREMTEQARREAEAAGLRAPPAKRKKRGRG